MVTVGGEVVEFLQDNFNPHHRTGGDETGKYDGDFLKDFNPHHRTGGDKDRLDAMEQEPDFNPHHRTGGDEELESFTD